MEAAAPQLSIEGRSPPPPSEQLPILDTRVVEAATLATAAAIAAFALIFWFRAGLKDPPLAVLSILVNCLLPIWLTALATCMFGASEPTRRTFVSAGLTVSLLFPISGLALGIYASVITAICVVSLAFFLWAKVGSGVRHSLFWTVLKSAPLALLLIVSGDPARLLLPEAMTLGLAHTDSYFHAAIAQMIARHFLPSTGADGLLYERYHFASHAVAAGLSQSTGASVALVYTYWGALSLKLQLLWAMFLSGLLLSLGPSTLRVRVFPRVLYSMLALILTSSLESESLLLGLAVFLGLLPLLCSLTGEPSERRFFRVEFVLAILTSFVCATAKVSVGFYCAVALLWIAWRHRRSYTIPGLALLGVGSLGVLTVRFLSPNDIVITPQALVHIVMSYAAYFIKWATLLSYAVPILVIVFAITRPRFARSAPPDGTTRRLSVVLQALRPKLRSWSAAWQTLLELDPSAQLLAVSLCACVLVLITIPIGSNMWYFSVVLLVAGSAVLPATLWQVSSVEISSPPVSAWLLGAVLAAGLACAQEFATSGSYAIVGLFRLAWSVPLETASAARTAAEQPTIGIGRRQIAESIRSTGTAFGLLHERIDALPWTVLLRDIRERNSATGGLVVHVLPSADEFWRRLSVGAPNWWCMAAHLMIPAETGIVEIRSIEPKAIERECTSEGEVWYGFGKDQDAHRTGYLSVGQLCSAARRLRSNRIYMLSSIAQPRKNQVVNCESP